MGYVKAQKASRDNLKRYFNESQPASMNVVQPQFNKKMTLSLRRRF